MPNLTSLARKLAIGGLCALTLGGSLVTSAAPAAAAPRGHFGAHGFGGHFGPRHFGAGPRFYGHGGYWRGGRWIGPALVGGLALGALAAPYAYGDRCWVSHRRFVDAFGRVYVRPVEVCG